MATTLVRVSERSRSMLQDLVGRTGRSRQAVIEEALEEYRRRRFFAEFDEAYGRMLDDPAGRAAEEADRRALDGALADGLNAGNAYVVDARA